MTTSSPTNGADHWREASSLIIAAKCPSTSSATSNSSNVDYKLLLTRRSGKSSYLANALCFPGGHLELADFSPDWWPLFEQHGFSRQTVKALASSVTGPRTPLIAQPQVLKDVDRQSYLPPEIGLRITAIREAFEETGVLVSTGRGKLFHANLKEWQKKVHDDASTFVQMFIQLNDCPDIWSLKEWWNWLTPAALGHKRFDTLFYVCCLDSLPNTNSDENEVSGMDWLTPQYVLQLHAEAEAFLPPPQVYELARLANFTSYDELKEFAQNREKHGVERWCANITGLSDGAILALPGDDFYNTILTSAGNQLPSLIDVRNTSKRMNRLELRAPVFTPICAQLQLPCGHVCPVACDIPSMSSSALSSHL